MRGGQESEAGRTERCGITRIKICGLRREEDIFYANALKPDVIGFVFASVSRRYVPFEKAAQLRAKLSPDIAAVGVFANEPVENILALLARNVIDLAQLHGSESEDDIRMLKRLTDKKVIKAFRVASRADVAAALASPADYILLDNGDGGTGECFDWTLLSGINRPFFLAGGLCAENVGEAVTRCGPFAVDASSGLETDGFKDYDKMKRFIEAVRRV